MPLFRSKFHPKKAPQRKKNVVSNLRREMDPQQLETEFDVKIEKIKLDLGSSQVFEFHPRAEPPKWIALNSELRKEKPSAANAKLESENNLLKLQVETLLDMVLHAVLWDFEVLLILFVVDRNYDRSSS